MLDGECHHSSAALYDPNSAVSKAVFKAVSWKKSDTMTPV